uniref:Gamma-butyrobetaine hydroxylase-like N-terminal domain-containing protein n=1 Tax=Dunaliella tertiolecta TaxID=3047 RepID=A0A7S3R3K3_DUNTE|mmetsp:Transcript_1123/g.2639  ORF Transcript_1123/g.2639 Transcript_1123/m.2639 type:complete len:192 (-) Transcript_1123:121-696(-)
MRLLLDKLLHRPSILVPLFPPVIQTGFSARYIHRTPLAFAGPTDCAAQEQVSDAPPPSAATQLHPTPLEVKLRKAEKRLDLKYSDGRQFSLPAELLRVSSPSADNQRPGRVVAGRRHVGIMGIQPVGRYAIRIQFDDLHHTGLYTWELLYDLGCCKLSRARKYIQQLRDQGLSREPIRSRSTDRRGGAGGR